MDSDDLAGVFGKTAGKSLKRLPSSVYWAGLGVWGIRLTTFSQGEYQRRIDETYRRRHTLKALEKDAKVRGDDVDQEQRMATLSWPSSIAGLLRNNFHQRSISLYPEKKQNLSRIVSRLLAPTACSLSWRCTASLPTPLHHGHIRITLVFLISTKNF